MENNNRIFEAFKVWNVPNALVVRRWS